MLVKYPAVGFEKAVTIEEIAATIFLSSKKKIEKRKGVAIELQRRRSIPARERVPPLRLGKDVLVEESSDRVE